jgi:hypothetical protein
MKVSKMHMSSLSLACRKVTRMGTWFKTKDYMDRKVRNIVAHLFKILHYGHESDENTSITS